MTTKELTQEVKTLQSRISNMRDEMVTLQSQMQFMGERIQKDMTHLAERVNRGATTNTTNYTGPR